MSSNNRIKSLGQFFSGVRVEFAKIVWPSRSEFVGSVIIALILIIAFAVYLGVVDSGLNWLMRLMFSDILGI